jgi:CelD/BcsL family acetyltransferase involved in cellulose biosynthesis
MPNTRTEWVSEPERFEALGPAWDSLAAQQATPFLFHGWFSAWSKAFGAGSRLRTLVLWREDELAGVFPLLARAGRLEAMADAMYTPIFRPFARDPESLSELLQEAMGAREGVVWLESLPANDDTVGPLIQEAQAARRIAYTQPHFVSPLVDTSGDFSSYREPRRSRWKETERRRRKVEREHDVRLSLMEPPGDIERELDTGLAVESSGWKGREGTAILSTEGTRTFFTEMARAYDQLGLLSLSSLWIDEKLAAFDLGLMYRERYYLLKTGYDEDLRTFSPGLVLRRAVIEESFERGLDAYELLGSEMSWKELFATHRREHLLFGAYRRCPAAMIHLGTRRARRRLKPLYLRAPRPPAVRRRWG